MEENVSVEGNAGNEELQQEDALILEVNDEFEVAQVANNTEIEEVKEGAASIQDLLTIIKTTGLTDVLPQAMVLLEIAAVTPLTSVHCERTFSRMKRVISYSPSIILQDRKEHLVLLQVEHSLLRWLTKQPYFHQSKIQIGDTDSSMFN